MWILPDWSLTMAPAGFMVMQGLGLVGGVEALTSTLPQCAGC